MAYITKKDIEFLEMIHKSNYLLSGDNERLKELIERVKDIDKQHEKHREEAVKSITEKRKKSPYYARPYATTQRHYSREVKKIQELLDDKEYIEAIVRFNRNRKELSAFKTETLNNVLYNFLNEFTDDELELLTTVKLQ